MNDNGKTQGAGQKGPVRRRARLAAICAQIARTTFCRFIREYDLLQVTPEEIRWITCANLDA